MTDILFTPKIIRPLNEINSNILEELNKCIYYYNESFNIFNNYIKNNNISINNKINLDVNINDNCLDKIKNFENKIVPVDFVSFYNLLDSCENNIIVKNIYHSNGIYLTNAIFITDKHIPQEYNINNLSNFKIKHVGMDTFYGTGFETNFLNYLTNRFNKNKFNDIYIEYMEAIYYYDYNVTEFTNNYKYIIFNFRFANNKNNNGSYVYYLMVDSNHKLIVEHVLSVDFCEINY